MTRFTEPLRLTLANTPRPDDRAGERPFNVDDVIARYENLVQVYRGYANFVEETIRKESVARKILIQFTSSREKDPEHLREKVMRPDKDYRDPLAEVTDLAGARVVVDFLSDVEPILRMLKDVFVVDNDRSTDYRIVDDPRVFDYTSAHYVVRLPDAATETGDLVKYRGLWCEVQVRTMLQHVWASIAHERLYKPRIEPPKPLKRRFYALRGLLEIADREFDSLRSREEERKSKIEEALERDELDVPLDYLSLPAFLIKEGITTKGGEPISGQTIIDLVEEAEVVRVDTLLQLKSLLNQLAGTGYRDLVDQVYEGRRRGGISQVRDAIRLADPDAYLNFALTNRPGFHPRLLREVCDGLKRLKHEADAKDSAPRG